MFSKRGVLLLIGPPPSKVRAPAPECSSGPKNKERPDSAGALLKPKGKRPTSEGGPYNGQTPKQARRSEGAASCATTRGTGDAPARGAKQRTKSTKAELLKFLRHDRELQLGFGQGLDDQAFGGFRRHVARSGHFADQQMPSVNLRYSRYCHPVRIELP